MSIEGIFGKTKPEKPLSPEEMADIQAQIERNVEEELSGAAGEKYKSGTLKDAEEPYFETFAKTVAERMKDPEYVKKVRDFLKTAKDTRKTWGVE